jgi:hypothetical protein
MIESKSDIVFAIVFLNVLAGAYFMLSAAALTIYLQGVDFSFGLLWWASIMAAIATMLAIHLEDSKSIGGFRNV